MDTTAMTRKLHYQAEELIARAEILERDASITEARDLYRRAIMLERSVLDCVDVSKQKTRGILQIGIASLLLRAQDYAQAMLTCHEFLSNSELPDFARRQLDDILIETLQAQQAREGGMELHPSGAVNVSLAGGAIGLGTARLDIIQLKLHQIEKLWLRFLEWCGDKPFANQAPTIERVSSLGVPVIAALAPGSFRFRVVIQTPLQETLPGFTEGQSSPRPEVVSQRLFNMMRTITEDDFETLDREIGNKEYRDVLVRLVRNIAPDGKTIGQIQFTRDSTQEIRREAATLVPQSRRAISAYVSRDQVSHSDEAEVTGVLRALHLDKNWIVIQREEGTLLCRIRKDKVFDDVVGPYVNRRVRVPGYWAKTRGSAEKRFILKDILPDD